MEYPEERTAKYIRLVAGMPIVLLGTLGNLLTIIVLCRKNMRKLPASIFLLALAVVDTMFLYLEIFHNWYLGLTDIFLRNTNITLCQLMRFLQVTVQWTSAWIIVSVTFQRLIAVCIPFKVKRLNTRTASCVSVITITTVSAIVSSHFFVTYHKAEYVRNNKTVINECAKRDPNFVYNIWPWIDIMVGSILPFILLIVCNCIIISRVLSSNKQFAKKQREAQQQSNAKVTNMTVMLLTLSFSFLIFTLPVMVYFLGRRYWNTDGDPHTKQKLRLFYTVASTLQGINHAVHFLLYSVSGTTFRKELTDMICGSGLLPCCKENRVGPTSNSRSNNDTEMKNPTNVDHGT